MSSPSSLLLLADYSSSSPLAVVVPFISRRFVSFWYKKGSCCRMAPPHSFCCRLDITTAAAVPPLVVPATRRSR